MSNLFTRFGDWVDSHGSKAGDHMIGGALIGAIVGGVVCLSVAVALESPVLLALGFVVVVGHIIYIMAVL